MCDKCSSTLLVEDEKVRVTRFDFGPDQETGWHIHEYDYVITAITDCFMRLQHPDGTETESDKSDIQETTDKSVTVEDKIITEEEGTR